MKAVIQRVSKAELYIENKLYSEIGNGLVVLVAIKESDGDADINFMAEKLANLRIFNDDNGKLNLSLSDINGDIMIVSNFTVYGETKKGRRPSYTQSAKPETAEKIYDKFVEAVKIRNSNVKTGVFRAMMNVNISNDGPVTLILES